MCEIVASVWELVTIMREKLNEKMCDLLVIRVVEWGMREVLSFLGEILWDAWWMYEHDDGIWILL